MTCANCNTAFDSKFCPNCGQTSDIHPVTLKAVMHDLVHAFTHADKGFLLTIKELLKRPGFVAKEYIEGKRKKYFNPLSFLVITMAVSAWLSYKSGYFESFSSRKPSSAQTQHDEEPVMEEKSVEKKEVNEGMRVQQEVRRIIVHDGKMLGLVLTTPLFAILSWAFFRRPRHGIAEHFVLQSYLFGLSNVFRVVIFIPLFLITGWNIQIVDTIFQVVFLAYLAVAFRQFFMNKLFFTIIKSILVLALFIALFWVFISGYAYAKLFVIDLLT